MCAVVSGYALREVATSVRVSCCRRALFEGLIGDGFVLPCSSICRHQRRVNNAAVRHVRSVCESRCELLRRTIIEAMLCD